MASQQQRSLEANQQQRLSEANQQRPEASHQPRPSEGRQARSEREAEGVKGGEQVKTEGQSDTMAGEAGGMKQEDRTEPASDDKSKVGNIKYNLKSRPANTRDWEVLLFQVQK